MMGTSHGGRIPGEPRSGVLSGTSTSFYHSQNIPLSQKSSVPMGTHLVNPHSLNGAQMATH